MNCMRNRVWYRGDASEEIEQLFKALGQDAVGCARFLSRCAGRGDVRKGLWRPAILVDTLAYLVKSDLNDVDFESRTAPVYGRTSRGIAAGKKL